MSCPLKQKSQASVSDKSPEQIVADLITTLRVPGDKTRNQCADVADKLEVVLKKLKAFDEAP